MTRSQFLSTILAIPFMSSLFKRTTNPEPKVSGWCKGSSHNHGSIKFPDPQKPYTYGSNTKEYVTFGTLFNEEEGKLITLYPKYTNHNRIIFQ